MDRNKQHISRKNENNNETKVKGKEKITSYHNLWASILSDPTLADRYHQILQLVKIILVLPIHTAEVERGFSQMNLIMTDKRNCLTTASLRSLLSIKRSKTDYKAYDPSGAIIRWAPMS